MKDHIERVLGAVFGLIFVALSLLVAVETVSRKLFNFSLQGADELGGYALAVGATIAFSLALTGRNHIRVDVFHERLPRWAQAFLNWLSIVFLAVFGLLMAWLSFQVIQDTMAYKSVAQTPWATPLVYPQAAWFAGLAIFGIVAFGYAVRATVLILAGRIERLNEEFHPRSVKEELDEELEDVAVRGVAPVTRKAGADADGPPAHGAADGDGGPR